MKYPSILFLGLLIIVSQSHKKLHERWQNFSATLLYPLLSAQKSVTSYLDSFLQRKKTISALESELALKNKQIDSLEAEKIASQATTSYYEEIKELIDFKKQYSAEKQLIVQILLKQFSAQTHFFLVDAGKNKQIEKDMIAVFFNNIVGKVTEVYPAYCKVLLMTDPLCKIAVKTARTHIRGIHEGMLSLDTTRIAYMSHLVDLEKDDLVITSGEGLVFPQGFAVGSINSCALKGLEYQVSVKPVLDLRSLTYCTLLQKGSGLEEEKSIEV